MASIGWRRCLARCSGFTYFMADSVCESRPVVDANAADATETYNSIISKMTWAGLVVIGAPLVGFMVYTLMRLLKGLRELTGLEDKDLMHPR